MKDIVNKIKNNRYKTSLILIGIILTMTITFGITYGYLSLNIDDTQITDINASVGDVEKFIFAPGEALTLTSAAAGYTGTTRPSATLISGADGHIIKSTYDVYLDIDTNSFEYTQDGTPQAELLLKVIDPNGVEIKDIDTLNYVTIEGQSGFDLTDKIGFFTLAINFPITTSDTVNGTTQEWDISLTFVDLTIDQTHNNSKDFTGNIIVKNGYIETLPNMILELNGGREVIEARSIPNFSANATTNEGMYSAPDDYGTSYYFRGAVDNNWVSFAGFYWRIVRINGDGSVRMVYSGTTAPTASTKVRITGTGTQIGTSQINSSYNLAEYAGYMYVVGQQHGNEVSSLAKIKVDEWYRDNIYKTGYHDYLADNSFCADRTAYTSAAGTTPASGIGSGTQYFGAYVRNSQSKPSLECPDQRDAFTVSDTLNGNGALGYPVGLLSADEIRMAGMTTSANSSNYLHTGQSVWALSPLHTYSVMLLCLLYFPRVFWTAIMSMMHMVFVPQFL